MVATYVSRGCVGVLAVTLLMLATWPAGAEQRDPGDVEAAPDLLRLAGEAEVSGETRKEFERLMEEALEADLPLEPLASKLLEGLAKGVPETRILAAVRTVCSRLERSFELLLQAVERGAAGPVEPADIIRVAAGFTAGVPPAQMALLMEAASRADVPVSRAAAAVGTLQDLRAMGVYGEEAVAALAAFLLDGRPEEDLRRLAEDYRRHAAAGGEAEAFFGAAAGDWYEEIFSEAGMGYDAAGRLGAGILPDEVEEMGAGEAGGQEGDRPGPPETPGRP